MNGSHRPQERGNVIFYILIAIALLSALSFAVSQSFRGSANRLTEERAKLLAAEIVEYSNNMAQAVAQLRLRGVAETSLCFDSDQWPAGYNYDHSGCNLEENRVFSSEGGGIVWQRIPEDAVNMYAPESNLWEITTGSQVLEIGSTDDSADSVEVLARATGLKDEVCQQINIMLNLAAPGDDIFEDTELAPDRFTGSFSYYNLNDIGDEDADLVGRKAACLYSVADDENNYYRVLLAR